MILILVTVGLILSVFMEFPWAANGSFHFTELSHSHMLIGIVFMLSDIVFKMSKFGSVIYDFMSTELFIPLHVNEGLTQS